MEEVLDFPAGQGKVHLVFAADQVTDTFPAEKIFVPHGSRFRQDFHNVHGNPVFLGPLFLPGQFSLPVHRYEEGPLGAGKEISLRQGNGIFIDFRLFVQGPVVIDGGASHDDGLEIKFSLHCIK